MRTQYRCGTEQRRSAVAQADAAHGQRLLNGIDFLEVVSADQRTLEVRFLRPLPGQPGGVPAAPVLDAAQLAIRGGVRVTGIGIESVSASGNVLTVVADRAGDFSSYVLRLGGGAGGDDPPDGFDPLLAEVAFSFKAGCPSDFDCAPADACPPRLLPEPAIDYLAKDYAGFRRLMLDRMAATMPGWSERNPSDLAVALVETLAYAADHLSYHQDAVATEAYLGTARRRVSLRRHARLLDYTVHEGASARAWVALEVDAASLVLPGPRRIEDGAVADAPGTRFLSRVEGLPARLAPEQLEDALHRGAEAFELLHEPELHAAWNELRFYTWGDRECCLPQGATRAFLRNEGDALADLGSGQVLVLEETRGPGSGRPEDADPAHRCVVRLTEVRFLEDPLVPEDPDAVDPAAQRLRLAEIAWSTRDALPFPLCVQEVDDPAQPGQHQPVSVARGNVVLVEHGCTLAPEALPAVSGARYRPLLAHAPLAWCGPVPAAPDGLPPVDPEQPTEAALAVDPRRALPALYLREGGAGGELWSPRRDLLDAGSFAREFVAEAESDGSVQLRFGDGAHGRAPQAGAAFLATYRFGGGLAGNVGAEAIAHVVSGDAGIRALRNPLPARGGADPETLEEVRLSAPQAFRTQERAVTEADYAAAAQRHPAVQRAAATFRWTGSWHTAFLTVDRKGGLPVDADFERELRDFLEPFPLAGFDLEIEPPLFVPLDIALTVCVHPGFLRSEVRRALLDLFSRRDLPDGRRGFFHPDNFTFGQPVYLSRIIAAAMAVPGVHWVDSDDAPPKENRFQRWSRPAAGEIAAGRIRMARLEIARLDNDPSLPENGRIEFLMEGGA